MDEQPGAPVPPSSGKDARRQAREAKAVRKAQRPWVMRHKILSGLGAIVAIAIIATAAGGGGSKHPAASVPAPSDSPAVNPSPATSSAAASPVAASPAVTATPPTAPKTLLDLSGSGINNTANFTTAGAWAVAYTYDCTSFGQSGNFAIYVGGSGPDSGDVAANQLGMKGSATSHESDGGTYNLKIDSECSWHVTVTG